MSLPKVKPAAKKLCNELNLDSLAKTVEKSKGCSLQMFFSVKSYKVDRPLRVTISEQDTWQKSVACFLQDKLVMLDVNDPLLIREFEDVAAICQDNQEHVFTAYSVDIKDS